ncbi:hypothetical protein [Azospirillum soli]|uniref:hypothetical protein n=1 Tax=Azospirillum soli TaxID=1304799 RepID=UPI001AE52371|nr:hypothetical protein [Azospirillum soli]MBP2316505.1 hypothetical protein [Azospirillum soli]
MTEKTETTKTATETDEPPKAESCCGSSAPKAKDLSKYDYRHKEHGQEGTRRKGCC